eukprot:3903027-Heterocapsa_arctica.AAC.1
MAKGLALTVGKNMMSKCTQHNIWAQRLTGKEIAREENREGRSTNDGRLELTNGKNIGSTKEGGGCTNR